MCLLISEENPPLDHCPPYIWISVTAVALLADQVSKWAVGSWLPLGSSIAFAEVFNLVHVRNTGAAFSVLANAGGWQRYFLAALALGISAWIVWQLRRGASRKEAIAWSLVLGGALGNVSDRILRGFVVDFLHFHWHDLHWPAFNLADISIFAGVVCLLLVSWKEPAPVGTPRSGELPVAPPPSAALKNPEAPNER